MGGWGSERLKVMEAEGQGTERAGRGERGTKPFNR